jgi:starch phosphorylase
MTPTGELTPDAVTPLLTAGPSDGSSTCRFQGAFRLQKAGSYGFNVRVVPSHADLATIGEIGLVTWA